jgi:hypothetical protein
MPTTKISFTSFFTFYFRWIIFLPTLDIHNMFAIKQKVNNVATLFIMRFTLTIFALKAFFETFMATRSWSITFILAFIIIMTSSIIFSFFKEMAFQFTFMLAFKNLSTKLLASTVWALFKVARLFNFKFNIVFAR